MPRPSFKQLVAGSEKAALRYNRRVQTALHETAKSIAIEIGIPVKKYHKVCITKGKASCRVELRQELDESNLDQIRDILLPHSRFFYIERIAYRNGFILFQHLVPPFSFHPAR